MTKESGVAGTKARGAAGKAGGSKLPGGERVCAALGLGVALLVVASLVVLPSRLGAADSAEELEGSLPSPRVSPSAVWDGRFAWIFGGYTEVPAKARLDEILRYDPESDTVSVSSTRLPTRISATSAAWDGSAAYVFGGQTQDPQVTETPAPNAAIVRFRPSEGAVETMQAELPSPRFATAAVWAGPHAYIFGGWAATGPLNEIVRFTPSTGSVETLLSRLPTPRAGMAAVWLNGSAYLFGGDPTPGGGPYLDEIVRFTPPASGGVDLLGTVETLGVKLPSPRRGPAAVTDGIGAFVFGGNHGDGNNPAQTFAEIVRFDPATPYVGVSTAALPAPKSFPAAVWMGSTALVFGGNNTAHPRGVRFTPDPVAPASSSSTTTTTTPASPPTMSPLPPPPAPTDVAGNVTGEACNAPAEAAPAPACSLGPPDGSGGGPPGLARKSGDLVERLVPGGWATIAVGGFGLSSIAVASRVPAVQQAVRRAVLGVPLFTRLLKDSALDQPVRAQIVHAVEQDPGVHFHELRRRLGVSRGALEHHLRKLVVLGLVSAAPGAHYTCYFPARAAGRTAMAAAPILKAPSARAILSYAASHPGAHVADVAAAIGVTPKGVHFHLQRLEGAGLLKVERSAAGFRLFATPNGITILNQPVNT